MSDIGAGIVAALALEILLIVAVVAAVFGGIGWAIGHFIF